MHKEENPKDKLPPGIHNRKKGKINKHQQTQQGLRAANDCQETETASEDVREKGKLIGKGRDPKLW